MAVELAASAGLVLDPWQELVLAGALGEAPDGKWVAREVGLIVPRQNGKGGILEARELAGLFLFEEQLILHSSHEFKTSAEAFRRILFLVRNTPDLNSRVAHVRTSHGDEGIELKTGARLRFVARSTGSGRGFSGDCIILDEAYNLSAAGMSALFPTMAARSNPQLWYTSSAPLPRVESDTLRRLCKRGRHGQDAAKFAYFEWSAAETADPDSLEAVAQGNPAFGIRIFEDDVNSERGALEPEDYARERLGIFPEEIECVDAVLPEEDWKACADKTSTAIDPVALAFEVSLDRKWAQIGVSAPSTAGAKHVELIENRRGTGWVVDRLVELRDAHSPSAIVCNVAGPAGTLLKECEMKGLVVGMPDGETAGGEPKYRQITSRDYAQACGAAFDEVTQHRWRHLDQPALNMAASNAAKRPMGDAWVFDRRGAVDISPLSCIALAAWAAERVAAVPKESEFIVV